MPIADTAAETVSKGLTAREAARRLAAEGPNAAGPGTPRRMGHRGRHSARTDVRAAVRRRPAVPAARHLLEGAFLALALSIGLRDGRWLEGLLAGTALAISLLPEEFAVILAVFPRWAPGAWPAAVY